MSLRVIGNTRYGSEPRDLVAEITDKVPSYVQIEALKNAYPNGRIVRNEFYLGSLNGEAGQSLKINIDPSSSEFMGLDLDPGNDALKKELEAVMNAIAERMARQRESLEAKERAIEAFNEQNYR